VQVARWKLHLELSVTGSVSGGGPLNPQQSHSLAFVPPLPRNDAIPGLQDKAQDFDSYCLLGDAFMAIQEPEKAVRAFDSALGLSPKDAGLALKCAEALVTAHDYGRAVDYYSRAIRNEPTNVRGRERLTGGCPVRKVLTVQHGRLGCTQTVTGARLDRQAAW
jgi:tetratricopeptide (TPR) repeat protein